MVKKLVFLTQCSKTLNIYKTETCVIIQSYFTNSDVKVLPKSEEIVRPPPVEIVENNQLTIEQLNQLFHWFYGKNIFFLSHKSSKKYSIMLY